MRRSRPYARVPRDRRVEAGGAGGARRARGGGDGATRGAPGPARAAAARASRAQWPRSTAHSSPRSGRRGSGRARRRGQRRARQLVRYPTDELERSVAYTNWKEILQYNRVYPTAHARESNKAIGCRRWRGPRGPVPTSTWVTWRTSSTRGAGGAPPRRKRQQGIDHRPSCGATCARAHGHARASACASLGAHVW